MSVNHPYRAGRPVDGHGLSYSAGVRALLVVNPQATATTAAGRDVLAHALASDVQLEIVETSYRGHAADAAARAVADGVDLVVAHGGDGTVNEVVNGLLAKAQDPADAPALGVVPGGSANVFARALGLPRDPVEATHRLLLAIESGSRREVGLGLVEPANSDSRWFTFNAGLGWDADVVAEVERRRDKTASPLLYASIALANYLRQMMTATDLQIELPDGTRETTRLAFVSNTDPWTYLGAKPIHMNPGCSFDGGLGLFALRSLAPPTIARTLSQILLPLGPPSGSSLLRLDDVAEIAVTAEQPVRLQVDGDDLGEHRQVKFLSVPKALRVAV
ncbi:diacylglycerol kinase family enzyme [Kutzneria buriramensis]|uniref:Diacylglycerol kinase family enzyme n=1 Tax=Kutzneria buriramensis TaxID=1045776 RepID=A0A3E0IB78_9PSEU|nr:diacylglycerol kinase family enzyme [Kutzneria buriramensis]